MISKAINYINSNKFNSFNGLIKNRTEFLVIKNVDPLTTMKQIEIAFMLTAFLFILGIVAFSTGFSNLTTASAQEIECISFEKNATSVAGPSPSLRVVPPETSSPSEEGIGSMQELEKLTGENRVNSLNPNCLQEVPM